MNPNISSSIASFVIIAVLLLLAFFDLGACRVEKDMVRSQMVGGISDITDQGANGLEMENLARFAVEEYNKKENGLLKFGRLVKAKEQVVAGKMYYLTLEAIDGSEKINVYEAKVWVKPWMNFKQMKEFKASHNSLI